MQFYLVLMDFCKVITFVLFRQGAGTALGELPPYFMAKAGELIVLSLY